MTQLSRDPVIVTQHMKKSSANNLCDKIGVPSPPPPQGEPFCGFARFSCDNPRVREAKALPAACMFVFLPYLALAHSASPLLFPLSLAGDLSIKELWVTGCALVLSGTLKVRGWRHVRSLQDPALMTASCWWDARRLNGWMDRWIEGRMDEWMLVVVAGKRAAPVPPLPFSLPPLKDPRRRNSFLEVGGPMWAFFAPELCLYIFAPWQIWCESWAWGGSLCFFSLFVFLFCRCYATLQNILIPE